MNAIFGETIKRLVQIRAWLPLLCVGALMINGCGTEPGVGSSGTGITGTQLGTVTGFGSIIVENNRYEDDAAAVTLETDPDAPTVSSREAVRLGMQVRVQFDGQGNATDIRITPQLIGAVQSVSANLLIVAGQPVQIRLSGSRPTVFEGFGLLGGLLNRQVTVFGERDENGVLRATRISPRLRGLPAVTLVTGIVSAQPAPGVWQIGNLRVGSNGLTRIAPAGAAIETGSLVTVWARDNSADNDVIARSLRVTARPPDLREQVRIGGLITNRTMSSDGTALIRIAQIDVTFDQAQFEQGSVSQLQPGVAVRVDGRFDGNRLQASKIRFINDTIDEERDITGLISDFFSAGAFRVRGVQVDASQASVRFDGGSAANLADGAAVRVRGQLVGGVVVAQRVTFVFDQVSDRQSLFGTVNNLQPLSGAFQLLGLPAQLTAATEFRDVAGQAVPRSQFTGGRLVLATGEFVAGALQVATVTFVDAPTDLDRRVQGQAYQVNPVSRVLVVNRVTVLWNDTTQIIGDINLLTLGSLVKVRGRGLDNTLLATRLEIID